MKNTAKSAGKIVNGMKLIVKSVGELLRRLGQPGRNTATKIVKRERVYVDSGALLVYDLSVEKHHCYRANGLLVSNSDAFRQIGQAIAKGRAESNSRKQPARAIKKSGRIYA